MGYCVFSDIGGVTGTSGRWYNITKLTPETTVTTYCLNASDLIDCKLRARYTVPFTTVPAIIKEIAMLLCGAWLLRDQQFNYEDEKITDPRAMEKKALEWLDDLASGKMNIVVGPNEIVTMADMGIKVSNVPINATDEKETDINKKSQFYLPSNRENFPEDNDNA